MSAFSGRPLHIFGLLPFRGMDAPKSRLSNALSLDERRELGHVLLDRAIDAMCCGGVARVAVVTLDADLVTAGIDPRADIIVQRVNGLNRAIREGQGWAIASGADGLLILLPDLPLVDAADISALLAAAHEHAAVIAPDRHGLGTNALLLCPPDAIPPAFGPGSADRHRRALALADLAVTDFQRPGTHLDLDTPDDLERLRALGHDWHTLLNLQHNRSP